MPLRQRTEVQAMLPCLSQVTARSPRSPAAAAGRIGGLGPRVSALHG